MEIIKELPDEVILWRAMNNHVDIANSIGYVVLDESEVVNHPDNRAGIEFAGKTYREIYYSKLIDRFTYYVSDKNDKILIKIVDSSVFDPKVVEHCRKDNNYTFVEGNDGYTYLIGGSVLYIISYGETEVEMRRGFWSSGASDREKMAEISGRAGGIKRTYRLDGREVEF